MNLAQTLKSLNNISAYQRGMFTCTQADSQGIERYTLSRLEKQGLIERLAKGVYRMGGAPSIREEDVYAIWLSLNPQRIPGNTQNVQDLVVAMGVTAAWLQQLGEIGPTPYEFCCSKRKQTQRSGIIVKKRKIDPSNVAIVGGIPTTKPGLTILDLIDNGEDLSLVAHVLQNALSRGLIENEERLSHEVSTRQSRLCYDTSRSLYQELKGAQL